MTSPEATRRNPRDMTDAELDAASAAIGAEKQRWRQDLGAAKAVKSGVLIPLNAALDGINYEDMRRQSNRGRRE